MPRLASLLALVGLALSTTSLAQPIAIGDQPSYVLVQVRANGPSDAAQYGLVSPRSTPQAPEQGPAPVRRGNTQGCCKKADASSPGPRRGGTPHGGATPYGGGTPFGGATPHRGGTPLGGATPRRGGTPLGGATPSRVPPAHITHGDEGPSSPRSKAHWTLQQHQFKKAELEQTIQHLTTPNPPARGTPQHDQLQQVKHDLKLTKAAIRIKEQELGQASGAGSSSGHAGGHSP